ncbi:Rha family transcriptional regulator [Bombilactobacillus folatiphilus]|uniref:Rha family transcriptional regulator n=1 Tax=Bombilactobacillus folatiphilus TaxID=2923362 RepID=A0ABY4PA15_9LACO|nr:Rha family transcriptional regulator [Bombilactobacillus folatiphilus]UQS82580.1 Rha family transcriptional regulator [Bombilactobacillus folatiphilus]
MNLVELKNNELVTTSYLIARAFNKQHKNVLRDIDILLTQINSSNLGIASTARFEECYKSSSNTIGINTNRKYRMFYLNRDAFTLVAMSYTTKEALRFKIEYLNEFNRMERQLKNQKMLTASKYQDLEQRLKVSDSLAIDRAKKQYGPYNYQTPERAKWSQIISSTMESKNITLIEIGEALNYSPNYIGCIIHGERKGINRRNNLVKLITEYVLGDE